MANKVCLFLFISLLLLANLQAVEVKKIEVGVYSEFERGELKGTSLDNRGRLTIGPVVKTIKGPGEEFYLSLDVAETGDIFIGTGHHASVFRVSPEGVSEEVFKSDDLQVYALVALKNGDLYLGTAPGGKIYRVKKGAKIVTRNDGSIFNVKGETPEPVKEEDRKSIELFSPDEKIIWDIKEDRAGNIMFSVGNPGGVYQIDQSGNGSKIFSAEDSHIISLFVTRNNAVLAGSGDRGILYRIENRKVKVLFDSPLDEIRGICEDREGNIFFSASRGIHNQAVSEDRGADFEIEPIFKNKKKKTDKEVPEEKSILYCLHTNGSVETIWASTDEYIYSLVYDEKSNSAVIGTGNFGRVYSVKQDGSFTLVYESESAQVFKVVGKANRYTLIGNNTATIAQIQDTLDTKGAYFSEIFDMGIPSSLGKIYWDGANGPKSGVALAIRTGNSNIPDKTWTDWSAPFMESENSTIGVSQVRYFQIKAALNIATPGRFPYLDSFRVFYVQANLPPQLKKIDISRLPGNPDKDKAAKKEDKIQKALTIAWDAVDPNQDRLKYDLYLKKIEHENWILVKENLTTRKFDLLTELFEDGKYVLKVAADDSLSNPPDTARTNSKISPPFIIDSTAPVLENFSAKERTLGFRVVDTTSIIAHVLYSLDGDLWYPVFPRDMINDSKAEDFSFTLNTDSPKFKKVVFIKVVDECNNYKVFQEEL